jgi:Methyltransferase FkbM domain
VGSAWIPNTAGYLFEATTKKVNMLRKQLRRTAKAAFPLLWLRLMAWRTARAERRRWDRRIALVISCPDNPRLSRISGSGRTQDGWQVMHNGLKVLVDGYYGNGISRMLSRNRGCHEPQEELVFQEVLRRMPPGAVMVECGAYWGFYSMWFCQVVRDPRVFLIEPEAQNLAVGRRNFELNGFSGHFTQAFVGMLPAVETGTVETVNMDTFFLKHRLDYVHILHSDIQGSEMRMLEGAVQSLDARCVRFVFISTHSEELHTQCFDFLCAHGYEVAVSVSPAESFSVDGVLVARDPVTDQSPLPQPSRNRGASR